MPRVMFGLFLGLTLVCNPVARAAWYASVANDKVVDCKYFSESLDQSWQGLSKRFGPCSLKMGKAAMVSGYVFHCGPDNAQLLFRTKDDCEVIKKQVNEGAKATPEAFAPKGTKNPTGWVVAIDGCLSEAVTDSSIAKVGLQKLNDYCLCTANELSKYAETELESDPSNATQTLAGAAKRCLNNLGVAASAEGESKIRQFFAQAKVKGPDSPKPMKDSIQLTKGLFVYDNWFFVTSKSDFDQMINVRSDAQTVKIGQRFGFKALFRSVQKTAKLRVELQAPERAENFLIHTGTVKVSDDHKTVTVDDEIDATKGSIAYHWGVGDGDPLGQYQIKFSLDGVPVKTYRFRVVSSGSVPKEFQTYLKRFSKEAAARKIKLSEHNLRALEVAFAFDLSDYKTLGQCDPSNLKIGLSESYWMTASDAEREELIFHELGHCLLGRQHDDRLMPISGGSVYKSVMNSAGNVLMYRFPNVSNCGITFADCGSALVFDPKSKDNFYNRFHKIYMDELFGVIAPNETATSGRNKGRSIANSSPTAISAISRSEESEREASEQKLKLKKGMTRQEVVAALGEPTDVATDFGGNGLDSWYFKGPFCRYATKECYVLFDSKTHQVVHWSDFKPAYIDYMGD